MNLFGGDQREAFVQVKAHLVTKHAFGARASAVCFGNAVAVHVLHEVFVLAADGAHKGNLVKTLLSLNADARNMGSSKVLYATRRIDGYSSHCDSEILFLENCDKSVKYDTWQSFGTEAQRV